MIPLTFAERYQQARLYAAQVRVRKAMGARYAHYQRNLKSHSMEIRDEHRTYTHTDVF